MNDLFSRALLTRKSQFLHKISSLTELVYQLDHEFQDTAGELTETAASLSGWERLDRVHYDLNSCLTETLVILKSFLHALPEPQLTAFENMKLACRR